LGALLALIMAFCLLAPALAVEPDEVLKDPALESRARALSQHLRCLVCQNQSIDDSAAPLARDLRVLVRERLVAGDSDQQVLDFLVQRYGSFVLLKPPLGYQTYVLWFGPFAVLGLGIAALWWMGLHRRGDTVEPLSPDEKRHLEELLAPHDESGGKAR
jgi:cytochrome c-type biogenesis protein CcmH